MWFVLILIVWIAYIVHQQNSVQEQFSLQDMERVVQPVATLVKRLPLYSEPKLTFLPVPSNIQDVPHMEVQLHTVDNEIHVIGGESTISELELKQMYDKVISLAQGLPPNVDVFQVAANSFKDNRFMTPEFKRWVVTKMTRSQMS